MEIVTLPHSQDNLSYLIIDPFSRAAAVIDPAKVSVIEAAVEREGVQLELLLCTHHHPDHCRAVQALRERYPGLETLAGAEDAFAIGGVARGLQDGDPIQLGRLEGHSLSVPCHTRGHLAYLFGDALFTGDTLFLGGCGRFFEGDAAQMDRALNQIFGALPGETRVFFGHEYSLSNLRFAQSIEPENPQLLKKLRWVEAQRKAGRGTSPSTLAEERSYNPFMRVREPSVQAAVMKLLQLKEVDPIQVMAALRRQKNRF